MEAKQGAPENSASPPEFQPDWPDGVVGSCEQLFRYDSHAVRGQDRLGSLAFDSAPGQLAVIRRILRDIAREHWSQLPPSITGGGLREHLQALFKTLDQMLALSADSPNSAGKSTTLEERLGNTTKWFREAVAPFAINARVDRRLEEASENEGEAASSTALREEYEQLAEQLQQIRHELVSQEEAVNQARATAGDSASEEMSAVYKERSDAYGKSAKSWLITLICAAPAAVGFAILTFIALRPDEGPHEAHDLAGLGLGIFILGILAFALRVCAQNYRVNRHLAAVCRSKESSISTFQRLASSVADEEMRSAVTLTLAQAIFAVEETGLIDGSGDHVTLVERAILPNLPGSSSS